jgi:hypothetical protein
VEGELRRFRHAADDDEQHTEEEARIVPKRRVEAGQVAESQTGGGRLYKKDAAEQRQAPRAGDEEGLESTVAALFAIVAVAGFNLTTEVCLL